MTKKYELTDETIEYRGRTLHRIRALIDIPVRVEAGELGGWIESEENLSHEGSCWVYDNAKAYENAKVHGNAEVFGNAELFGDAKAYGNSWVYGDAKVCGHAEVFGTARVHGDVMVFGKAKVCGDARVFCDASVYGHAFVHGHAMVYDNARVFGQAMVYDNTHVHDKALICESAMVYGNANVHDDAEVRGDAMVCGNAIVRDGKILKTSDLLVIGPVGSRDAYTTLNTTSGTVCTGCFKGTIEEFEKAVRKKHGDDEYGNGYERVIAHFKDVFDNVQAKQTDREQ